MYFVYILLSQKDNKMYIGCTNNVTERFRRHNSGEVFSTKYRRPFVLLHTEEFDNKTDAFSRERFLKSLWSARFKEKLLTEYKRNKK